MDISIESINYIGGSTELLKDVNKFMGLQSASISTQFGVSITFKVNSGPSFDHINIQMDKSLIGDKSVNTTQNQLNNGLITTDTLMMTTGINYIFTLNFYDSEDKEITTFPPVIKYIKIQPDLHGRITSSNSFTMPDYSFYYEAILFGGQWYIGTIKTNSGKLTGKPFTGLKVQSTIGSNGNDTTLTIPSSSEGIISAPGVGGLSGGIFYIIFYAEIGSNTDTRRQVFGNNGAVSCSTYCAGKDGKSWNSELPLSWPGATCIASGITNAGNCDIVGVDSADHVRRICLCEKSDTPWGTVTYINDTPITTPVIGLWNFSFNDPPFSTSEKFVNKVDRDSTTGIVTINPPVGGWKVTIKDQNWQGGFSNHSTDPNCTTTPTNNCDDLSNLIHVDKSVFGGGHYTPKQNIIIPVSVWLENGASYGAYMFMNTNGTIYGLFLPEADISVKNPVGFIKITDTTYLQLLQKASLANIYDPHINNSTVWYFSKGTSTGYTYTIKPPYSGKIQYIGGTDTIANYGSGSSSSSSSNPTVTKFELQSINYQSGSGNSYSVTATFNVMGSNFDHIDIQYNNGQSLISGTQKTGSITTNSFGVTVGNTYTFTLKLYNANNQEIPPSSGSPTTAKFTVKSTTYTTTTTIPNYSFYYDAKVSGAGGGGASGTFDVIGASGGNGELKTDSDTIRADNYNKSTTVVLGKGGIGGEFNSDWNNLTVKNLSVNGENTSLTIGSKTITATGGNSAFNVVNKKASAVGNGGAGGTGGARGIMATRNNGQTLPKPGNVGANGSVNYTIYYATLV